MSSGNATQAFDRGLITQSLNKAGRAMANAEASDAAAALDESAAVGWSWGLE
jgi:hypothetical protein